MIEIYKFSPKIMTLLNPQKLYRDPVIYSRNFAQMKALTDFIKKYDFYLH